MEFYVRECCLRHVFHGSLGLYSGRVGCGTRDRWAFHLHWVQHFGVLGGPAPGTGSWFSPQGHCMSRHERGPWAEELNDLTRAFSGAFLFAIPLLFTMEMWWIGQYANLWKLIVFLVIAFLANLGLIYFAGFEQQSAFRTSFPQAVKAVAVGVVGAVVVLLILNRIQLSDPLDSTLGKIIIQAIPLSIGASVANAVFAGAESRAGENGQGPEINPWRITFNDLGAAMIGSVFISLAVAPTQEIPMLAAEMSYWHEFALIVFSVAISYAIVFESGFDPAAGLQQHQAMFRHPIAETLVTYLLALVVTAVILFLFDRIEFGDPFPYVLSQIVVLALPAGMGGAAGRLAI